MKRLIALLMIAVCLLAVPVVAEKVGKDCACRETTCICFLQLQDEGAAMRGVIALLKEKGYLTDGRIKVTYTAKVEEAIKAFQAAKGLESTGLLDDETLTQLIWDMSSTELDAEKPLLSDDIVWVPTGGGEKYHGKINCSGMEKPRKMTRRNADALQIEPCRRCNQHVDE